MLPFSLWVAASMASILDLPFTPWVMLICDMGFWFLLCVTVIKPILRVKQWRQTGLLVKLILLGGVNLAFYSRILGWFADGIRLRLYGGLYLIIGLVLTMARRIIPLKNAGFDIRSY